jgi:hypothetical protein
MKTVRIIVADSAKPEPHGEVAVEMLIPNDVWAKQVDVWIRHFQPALANLRRQHAQALTPYPATVNRPYDSGNADGQPT